MGTPGSHCACAGVLASRARAFPSSAWRGGKASPGAHASIAARPPPCGQGNPHTPQCALGAGWGNRLKPEWGLLRRWRGRESERGLPEVPAPALAVALATGRAGRSEGGGGLREAGRLCACVELGAGGRGSPSCAPGTCGGEGRRFAEERMGVWGGGYRGERGFGGGEVGEGTGRRGGYQRRWGKGEGLWKMGRGVSEEEEWADGVMWERVGGGGQQRKRGGEGGNFSS